MEQKWQDEVKHLSLDEQWKKLYDRKAKMRTEDESIWGAGSNHKNTKLIRKIIPEILEKYNIKKFIDIGCADNFWMSHVDFGSVKYTGLDIVPDLIQRNKRRIKNRTYRQFNVVDQVPPKADIIFCRNVLCHLSLDDCSKAIENIKKSGTKYLMLSTNPKTKLNRECECIILNPRNMRIKPFNFPEPEMLIREQEDTERYDQFMGIWDISKL